MTDRLYYSDSTLVEFRAKVVACDEQATTLYLDRTAFYPASGGQPQDTGTLNDVAVVEVVDEGERVAHRLAAPLREVDVFGTIDWPRRFDHMQHHTGQHLLSAVLAERFGISTVSFHLGDEAATIDVDAAGLSAGRLAEIEAETNREIHANRPVTVAVEEAPAGLRKASERSGPLRVITIDGLDRSACGGTHVLSTGQIGIVTLRKVEKVRQSLRIEFLCGGRAVARARADFEALSAAARTLSVALDQVPANVAAVQNRVAVAEKALAKLTLEAAIGRGAATFRQSEPNAAGRRVHVAQWTELADEARAEAQGFTQSGSAVYLGVAGTAILLAVSPESGLNAGAVFKTAVGQVGGRGGGGKTLAQGTSDDPEAVIQRLRSIADV